jgi:hypothetical protein
MGDEPNLRLLPAATALAVLLVLHAPVTQVRANDGQLFTTLALCHVLLSCFGFGEEPLAASGIEGAVVLKVSKRNNTTPIPRVKENRRML